SPPPVEETTTTTARSGRQSERVTTESPPEETPRPPALGSPPLGAVLPRTGGDSGPARLAAAALGLAVLGRKGARRATRRRR
ncbi:MAG TPA: hypothetical protein VHL53_16305, partial [Acidimicrobiia bacterium]|nr:hypothetical protein [Acidimicrobiia bacterium]